MINFTQHIETLMPHLSVAPAVTTGKVVRVVGLTLEAKGIAAPMGAICRVERGDSGQFVDAEVVGFQADLL